MSFCGLVGWTLCRIPHSNRSEESTWVFWCLVRFVFSVYCLSHFSQVKIVMVCQKTQNANDDSVTVYIVRTRTYWKSPLFWLVHFPGFWLANRPEIATSDWFNFQWWLVGHVQSSFGLNKFIFGPFRSRMRAHNLPKETLWVTFEWIFRKEHEMCYNDMY